MKAAGWVARILTIKLVLAFKRAFGRRSVG